jgi:beta-glucuronidase
MILNFTKCLWKSETDTIEDEIGFRNIEVKGNKVFLNGKMIFLKGINIHEEQPYKGAKAFSREDALLLLNSAKELGAIWSAWLIIRTMSTW